MLVYNNYLSQKDIEICLDYDIAHLSSEKYYKKIKKLHDVFVSEYKEDEEWTIPRWNAAHQETIWKWGQATLTI